MPTVTRGRLSLFGTFMPSGGELRYLEMVAGRGNP